MENRNNRSGMRGPGMGRRPAEKSKDFKGTWRKIIRYCKRYLAVIIVALICAVAGTILTILGPDKLSDLTKVITEGIATGIDMERVKSIGLTLVAFYVGSAILCEAIFRARSIVCRWPITIRHLQVMCFQESPMMWI